MTSHRHNHDPRVDAYIAKAADFAQPILKHLRELVHEACPEVQENIKWGMPSFEYKGMLCGMASFKQHCAFGFWKHELVVGSEPSASKASVAKTKAAKRDKAGAAGMGEFGKITKIADLPARRKLIAHVRKAVKLNEAGVKAPRVVRGPKVELKVPSDLAAALKASKLAAKHFAEFSHSKRKDYIEWLTEAKTEATRSRRLATAIEWIGEGKGRNWRYERC